MKKITCSDLGGPESCEVQFRGDTPDDVVKNCQDHMMEEVEKGDSDHQDAVENMQSTWKYVPMPLSGIGSGMCSSQKIITNH